MLYLLPFIGFPGKRGIPSGLDVLADDVLANLHGCIPMDQAAQVCPHTAEQPVIENKIKNLPIEAVELGLLDKDTATPALQIPGIGQLMLVGGVRIGHEDAGGKAMDQLGDRSGPGPADHNIRGAE